MEHRLEQILETKNLFYSSTNFVGIKIKPNMHTLKFNNVDLTTWKVFPGLLIWQPDKKEVPSIFKMSKDDLFSYVCH